MIKCPVCDKQFESYENMRNGSNGPWCKPCQNEFDEIDWDEVHNCG